MILSTETTNTIEVFRVLEKKIQLLRDGHRDHEKLKVVIVFDGGGLRGVFGAGVAWGMQLAEINDVFDVVIGCSAGGADAAYFLSGDVLPGLKIYTQRLTTGFVREYKYKPPTINIPMLMEYISAGEHALDVPAVLHSRSAFNVVVCKLESGEQIVIDAKQHGILESLHATMALPIFYNDFPEIPGIGKVTDGLGLPLPHIYANFAPDALIVVSNLPVNAKKQFTPLVKRIGALPFTYRLSERFREHMWNRHAISNRDVAWMATHPGIGVIAPKQLEVDRFETNPAVLTELAREGAVQALALFAPEKLPLVDELLPSLTPSVNGKLHGHVSMEIEQ